jgi:probable HAF family extracellular repeat protein
MTASKQIPDPQTHSAAAASAGNSASLLTSNAVGDGYKSWILFVIIAIAFAGAVLVLAQDQAAPEAKAPAQTEGGEQQQYYVFNLDTLGGTNSRGNSLNNRGWVAGYSNLPGNQSRHAALWPTGTILDLGTLGGPNSSVTWSVKNNRGLVAGIAQTAMPDPLGESWSSAAFFPGPNNVGFICLGFVWELGEMRALPTLGGNNGFATGANDRGQVVGWAENTCHDAACVPPQVLQFRPVVWGPGPNQIREFPLINGDTSGAATAINERSQAVGISGICDQAVGRHTAKHAVLWEHNHVTDIGNLGALFWNTPTAINQQGDIVGFAGTPGDPDGNILHGFIWTRHNGIRPLGALPGHVHSEAYGINERRQVVGISCDENFVDCRAFVWDDGVMTDLNAVKQPGYSARLEQAKDINDRGEITGRAIDPTTGMRTAFVALPKP